MDTRFNLTVELTAEDVKEAVIQYVQRNAMLREATITPSDVSFQMAHQPSNDPRDVGRGPLELNGAKISVRQRPESTYYMDR